MGTHRAWGKIQKAPESILPWGIKLNTLPWNQLENVQPKKPHGEMGLWYSALHQPQ